jgi:hypothetical protein
MAETIPQAEVQPDADDGAGANGPEQEAVG